MKTKWRKELILFLVIIILSMSNFNICRVFASPLSKGPQLTDITVYSSTYDGRIYKYGYSTYPEAWSAQTGNAVLTSDDFIQIGQYNYYMGPPQYVIHRGYLYFDTSTIPDSAVITSATLSMYGSVDASTFNFDIVIQNGQPTYPHLILETGDYFKDHYLGNGGSINTLNFVVGSYNNINFVSSALSWINKTSYTKLCLRSSKDISGYSTSRSRSFRYSRIYLRLFG